MSLTLVEVIWWGWIWFIRWRRWTSWQHPPITWLVRTYKSACCENTTYSDVQLVMMLLWFCEGLIVNICKFSIPVFTGWRYLVINWIISQSMIGCILLVSALCQVWHRSIMLMLVKWFITGRRVAGVRRSMVIDLGWCMLCIYNNW